MFDTHMHTDPFSTDSKMKLDELLRKKEESGLGIVLTEHMDYDFPLPLIYDFDVKKYFLDYGSYRDSSLLLGVEIGLMLSVQKKNRKLVQNFPFDMVIGSVHAVRETDLYDPAYFQLFSDKETAYSAYLETIYENIKEYEDFDTLGHIDYIVRSAPYEDPVLRFEDFPEILSAILRVLAEKEKSLEINTRLFGNQNAVHALERIILQFVTEGGKTVTIGSDAHTAENVGFCLKQAYELAIRCGVIPVYYKKRKAYPIFP